MTDFRNGLPNGYDRFVTAAIAFSGPTSLVAIMMAVFCRREFSTGCQGRPAYLIKRLRVQNLTDFLESISRFFSAA